MRLSLLLVLFITTPSNAFQLVMMGSRRGKGGLKKSLDPTSVEGKARKKNKKVGVNALNEGRGQEVTGVTLPAEGTIKGWEFGGGVRMACTNVDGNFYALQGTCPRCGFDLFKGTMIVDDPGWDSLPRVACPTCSTTYGWRDGKHGPPLKQKGLSAFVGSLAKTATTMDAYKNAKAYRITRDQDGRVFCKEAPQN